MAMHMLAVGTSVQPAAACRVPGEEKRPLEPTAPQTGPELLVQHKDSKVGNNPLTMLYG